MNRILVIRPDRIGDLILTLPLIESLKFNDEANEVWVLVRDYTSPLLVDNPFVDNIILVGELNFQECLNIRNRYSNVNFSISITLTSDFMSALVPLLLKIPTRIGPGNRLVSLFYNKIVSLHRTNSGLHETTLNLKSLQPLKYEPIETKPHLYVSDEERKSVKIRLSDMGYEEGTSLVVIHPGSGDSSRPLPTEMYVSLARRLSEDRFVIITGIPEKDPVHYFIPHTNERFHIWEERDLRSLMALIHSADLFIGGDTGPMHIASAFNTPVLGIFSPIRFCAPERWGPLSEKREVLIPDVPECENECESCEFFDCMDMIDVDIIYERVLHLFREV